VAGPLGFTVLLCTSFAAATATDGASVETFSTRKLDGFGTLGMDSPMQVGSDHARPCAVLASHKHR
jgi:hypothetical protein